MKKIITLMLGVGMVGLLSCSTPKKENVEEVAISPNQQKLDEYAEFTLTADLTQLSEKEKEMIPILIQVSKIMDGLFWKQSVGDKATFLADLDDVATIGFAEINYGPWDRLGDNAPFC